MINFWTVFGDDTHIIIKISELCSGLEEKITGGHVFVFWTNIKLIFFSGPV
jgi:hypothetical protein